MFLIGLVLAGEATRCTAVWAGPAPGCPLIGSFEVDGTASTKKGAERAARAQLSEVLLLSAQARIVESSVLSDADFGQCDDLVAQAYVNCFPEPELALEKFCFITLDAPECWSGEVLTVETDAWRALEEGRRQLCLKVDERLVQQNYSGLELNRAKCQAVCQDEVKARCP